MTDCNVLGNCRRNLESNICLHFLLGAAFVSKDEACIYANQQQNNTDKKLCGDYAVVAIYWDFYMLVAVEVHACGWLRPERSADSLEHIHWVDVSAESHLINRHRRPVENSVVGPHLGIFFEELVIALPKLFAGITFKASIDTALCLFEVLLNLCVGVLRTLFGNVFEALLMDVLHVIPPEGLVPLEDKPLMETHLPKVLKNYVFALDEAALGTVLVGRTVAAIAKALVLLEVVSAGRARPSHEARLEYEPAAQLVAVVIKLL